MPGSTEAILRQACAVSVCAGLVMALSIGTWAAAAVSPKTYVACIELKGGNTNRATFRDLKLRETPCMKD